MTAAPSTSSPDLDRLSGLRPIGAILGDFVGSRFERHNLRTEDIFAFEWATPHCRLTDDSVLTLATCEALMSDLDFRRAYRACVVKWGNVGFSKSFLSWARAIRRN